MTTFVRAGTVFPSAQVKTVVVNVDRAVNGNYPALRFPGAGYVVGARLFADVATSGTNLIQAGLINGGVTGAGTTITGPLTAGTTLAGSAYLITIDTTGPDIYAEGELAMIKIVTENTTTDVSVQIDYVVLPTDPAS